MSEDNPHMNPGVAPTTIGSKQQVANPAYCLIKQNLQSANFVAGDKCLQCGVHTSPVGNNEIHLPANPEFSCQVLNPIPEDKLKNAGVKIVWEKGYPDSGCIKS